MKEKITLLKTKHIILFFVFAFTWLFTHELISDDNYEMVAPGFETLETVKCGNSNGESMDFPDNACHLYGTPTNLSIGDVIVYKKGNHSVIHRIVEINDSHVITKGDNVFRPDKPILKNRIIYKVLQTIHFDD